MSFDRKTVEDAVGRVATRQAGFPVGLAGHVRSQLKRSFEPLALRDVVLLCRRFDLSDAVISALLRELLTPSHVGDAVAFVMAKLKTLRSRSGLRDSEHGEVIAKLKEFASHQSVVAAGMLLYSSISDQEQLGRLFGSGLLDVAISALEHFAPDVVLIENALSVISGTFGALGVAMIADIDRRTGIMRTLLSIITARSYAASPHEKIVFNALDALKNMFTTEGAAPEQHNPAMQNQFLATGGLEEMSVCVTKYWAHSHFCCMYYCSILSNISFSNINCARAVLHKGVQPPVVALSPSGVVAVAHT